MAWTKDQKEAIYLRGKNIIVSAGAGSGKTAVLSERILDFCMQGGDIRRVLVLTFTEAAAGEMKERIRKNLIDKGLDEQAELIDSAYITTFDSYSLSIVKRYYYKLDLKKDVSIMDGALITVKLNEVIRELFTNYYQKRDTRFYTFLRKYSLQNDEEIVKMVSDMANRLDLIVDADTFVEEYSRNYFNEAKLKEILSAYKDTYMKALEGYKASLQSLIDSCEMDEKSEKLLRFAQNHLDTISKDLSYEELFQILSSLKYPAVPKLAGDEVKEKKTVVSDILKELQKNYFGKYITTEEMKNEILSTKDDVLFLLEMCQNAKKNLMEFKRQYNMFGFSDIAKFAIELVNKHSDVREELSNSYDEILVDEYQDTSDIQEAFLSLIENNNRYMVGDIKQSIYRFRNANPYIFKSKYDSYGKEIGGHKIDLTFNFRSRSEVLDNINLLFNALMTDSIGDANYEQDHQMHYGNKAYLDLNQPIDFNMEVLSYEGDEASKFTQAENEAFIIGREIKKIMDSKVQVLSKKGFREVAYNDFAILIANANDFVTFKSVFEYLNLPLSIEASLDLKDSILPILYSNVLKAVYLEREKDYSKDFYHAVASLARSFIYEYSDQQIFDMVKAGVRLPILEDIKALAQTDEISYLEFFSRIDSVMHVYQALSKIGNVDSNLVVLDQIRKTFAMFDSIGYSFKQASEYMDELLSSSIKMDYKPSSSAKESIRIMTIHKSKGLEFPYCFFPMLTKGFNQSDMRASVGLSDRYGIFIPAADEGKTSTIIRSINKEETRKADISEKVRLFYVALTRAREKMYLVLPKSKQKEVALGDYQSFAEMIWTTKTLMRYEKVVSLADYGIESYQEAVKTKVHFEGNKALEYEDTALPKELQKARISKSLKSIPDVKQEEAIALGLQFHSALEALELSNPNIDSLPINDEMKSTLRKLLSHPIFEHVSAAKEYHEHEFFYNRDGVDCHGIIDLFLEYEDHIDIIDYKLSNTDADEYKRQLSIYRDYVVSKTNKPVSTYLLSILKQEIIEVEI